MSRQRNPALRLRGFVIAVLFSVLTVGTVGAETSTTTQTTPGLTSYRLPNGLELFVYENHVVPLTKIQITFRCGSITQTPETAGLFHLYEHMLFKGNAVYRSESEFQAAMKQLGVSSWNGGTANEQVSYYFTVPSSKTALGIEFWANAVRHPLFDPAELETEKQVVINEIRGYLNSPDDVFESAMDRYLYAAYPWRRDISGSERNVQNATIEQMLSIQRRYYIPNNAALFVGGDVDPETVQELAVRFFGTWPEGQNPWSSPPPAHPAPDEDHYLVYGDDQMYSGVARVTVRFRGPDVLRDPNATYAADVWGKFMDDPNGRLRANLMEAVPGLYNRDYIWAFYFTQRDGGYIELTTYLTLNSKDDTFRRVKQLRQAVQGEIARMIDEPEYFPSAEFDLIKVKIADELMIRQETPDRLVSDLSFWWASANTDYYLGYVDRLGRISRSDLTRYLATYLVDAKAIVGLRINPDDLDSASAGSEGFVTIDKLNAFWWESRPQRGEK